MQMKKNTKLPPQDNSAAAKSPHNYGGGFRLIDLFVVILFLSIAIVSVNLFRTDFLQTINLRNVEPVGTVIIRRNVVQRRLADRVLWDRLASASPVFLGDLIRVAEHSAATLYMKGNTIDLNENTLIRIMLAADGETLQIIMDEGTLSLSMSDAGGIFVDVNGMLIQPDSTTMLSITATQEGTTVQVTEGTALVIENEYVKEVHAGGQLALDADGLELFERATVVTHPVSNARFINGSLQPFTVNFLWNRINFNYGEKLNMEVASDIHFNNVIHIQEDLENQAQIILDNGLWFWRLLHENTIMNEGRVTVTSGLGPALRSPITSSVFNYSQELPVLNFQWDTSNEADSYIIEICDTPYFVTPGIRRETQLTSFTDSSLTGGTWFWRVKPVFPAVYTGEPSFSQVSYFRIERSDIEPETEEISLTQWLITEIPPGLIPPPEPPEPPVLSLGTPARGARIDGLTALRQRTVFLWECEAEIISSRFVLSRNPDPFMGQPAVEIINPDRNISIERLSEGTWHWNVEALTADGFTVRAEQHGVLRVLPIPLLPAPSNLQPVRNRRFTTEDLLTQRSINFTWQAVRGANTYVFTIYQQTERGRRRIYRSGQLSRTNYLIENLSLLDVGTFFWQVEALNRGPGGSIDQRGNIAESIFIFDFNLPGAIRLEGSGEF